MGSINIGWVALAARMRIPPHVFDRYLPASPVRVGEELAEAVQAWVRENRLGYYPALEYFRDREDFDKDLLDAADHIAWVATSIVREEIQTKLRPVFSSVRFDALQCLAFTLPPVRPGQANAAQRLARHYTPDHVKVDLSLSLLRREQPREGLERFASHVVCRWLKPAFLSLEVTAARMVSNDE